MGGGQSTPVAEILDGSYEGYHVVKVHKDSPAELAGLVPLFDFIVSINEERLYKEDSTFVDQLNANIGVPIPIIVYNSRVRGVRELIIVPSNSWGGAGLLGASIRFCSFETATENVWHVLDVRPNSPVSRAGLKSDVDYILGSCDTTLYDQNSFYQLVEAMNKKPVNLYVYDISTDSCREVTVTPDTDWGGDGSLGCSMGYGLLHRIPVPANPEDALQSQMGSQQEQQKAPVQKPIAPPPTDKPVFARAEVDAEGHEVQRQSSFHHHPPHLYHDLDGVAVGRLERNSITSAPQDKIIHDVGVQEYLRSASLTGQYDANIEITEPFQLGGVPGIVAAPYQMTTLSPRSSPAPEHGVPTSALQSQVPQQQMQNQQQQQQQRRRQQQIQQSQQQTQEAQQATQPHQPQHAQQFAQPPQQHTHQHKEQVTQQQPPHAQAQAPVPSLQQSVTPSAMPQSAMPQSHTPATQPYSTEGMTPQSTQPPLAGPELNQSHQTTAPHGQAHADTSKSSASIPTTGETNTVVLNTESSTESSTPGASSAEQVNSTAETVQDITLVQPTLPAGNPDVPILPTQQ